MPFVQSGNILGPPGPIGPDGLPAYTLVATAPFTVPAYGATVVVSVAETDWAAVGEWVWIEDADGPGVAGQMQITAKTATSVTLLNPQPTTLDLADDTKSGLLAQLSGLATDYVDGTNACHPLVLADATQNGLLRKVSGVVTDLVAQTADFVDGTNACQPLRPIIWAVRLRSYNAIGNPNSEVDQISCGAVYTNFSKGIDRWISGNKSGTLALSAQQNDALGRIVLPGTSFAVSSKFYRYTLTTAQSILAAGDYFAPYQDVEGPQWRELSNDVHSVSLLVRSSVANLNFGVAIHDLPATTKSLTKLCNIPTANTWTLIQLPNLPVFPSGNFVHTPGAIGYAFRICLAAGATFTSPANDTWQNGYFFGAVGLSNFAASPVGSTFDVGFVQHEPGPLCTQLIDKPFSQNLDECLRYYCKSYDYGVIPGTVTPIGKAQFFVPAAANAYMPTSFKKTMAKDPTMIGYSAVTGASGNVRDEAASLDRAISNPVTVGQNGFSGFFTSTQNAAATTLSFHYTADTGW